MTLFSAVAVSYPAARPSDEQRTYFEHDVTGSLSDGAVESTSQGILGFMLEMLLENWILDRVVFSTFISDSSPYEPSSVRTFSFGVAGSAGIPLGTSPAPDETTLFIRRQPVVGRTGKILLRGALTMSDLDNVNGKFVLTSAARGFLTARLAGAWVELQSFTPVMIGRSLLSTTYPATPEGTPQVPVKVYDPVPHVRSVVDMNVVGVRTRQVTQ